MSPDEAAIERTWHIGRHNNLPFVRRYNVAPSAVVPVLRRDRAGGLELATARWGLIPPWWKDARPPAFTFNARIEDVAQKPMWRDALRRTRCLVPAEGWYEWYEDSEAANPRSGGRLRKQPYFIHRRDRRLLSFAGLLSRWVDPHTGEATLTCTILTTAAKGALAAIHPRMPLVAPAALHDAWLQPDLGGVETVQRLVTCGLPRELEHHAVGMRVNDARVDGPELIEPLPA